NFDPFGNDFALDDISFREICVEEADVSVPVSTLSAAFIMPSVLCALTDPVDTNDYLTADATPGGFWTVDGQPVTTFVPAELDANPHTLMYSISDANCQATDAQDFTTSQPPAAGTPNSFNECFDAGVISLDLSNALSGGEPGGTWAYLSGPTGATIDPVNGQFSTDTEGAYQYTYTVDGGVFCPDISAVLAFDLFENPVADLPSSAALDCIVDEVELVGANTSIGNNMLYSWFENGVLLDNQFQRFLNVNEAGTYRLVVTDEDTGCTDEATTEVVSLVDDIDFELTTIPAVCEAANTGSISVQNISGGSMPYLVSLDGETFTPATDFTSLSPGNYTLTVQDAGGCEQTASTTLPMPQQPEVMIESSAEDNTVGLGESVTFNVISNPPLSLLDTFFWQPALADSLRISDKQWAFVPTQTTDYLLTAVDANGCTTTASLALIVRGEGNVFVPNAFSPNEDGSNDRFALFDNGSIANINSLQIFDRWGAVVYARTNLQANDTTEGWDGRHKGQLLPTGTYIYAAEVQWINGQVGQLQGAVHLVY
ncbi:MAG: gliding motility-associated C-terminal domain-containing protein, partial [Bacteroidota bacterium]